jgi:hypothetical protein
MEVRVVGIPEDPKKKNEIYEISFSLRGREREEEKRMEIF